MLMPPQGLTAGMLFTKIWKTLKKTRAHCSCTVHWKNPTMDAKTLKWMLARLRLAQRMLRCFAGFLLAVSPDTPRTCVLGFSFSKKKWSFFICSFVFLFFISTPTAKLFGIESNCKCHLQNLWALPNVSYTECQNFFLCCNSP